MVLQPAGRTATNVAISTGELLPHLLTLDPTSRAGYFLLRDHTLTDISSFRSAVPCAVRTFLPFVKRKGDRIASYGAKIQKNIFLESIFMLFVNFVKNTN